MKTKKNIDDRVRELMSTKISELPKIANDYCRFLCKEYGGCGEIVVTAFFHYAQKIEKFKCKNKSYMLDKKMWKKFEETNKR